MYLMFTRQWGEIKKGRIKAELVKIYNKRHLKTDKAGKKRDKKRERRVIRDAEEDSRRGSNT